MTDDKLLTAVAEFLNGNELYAHLDQIAVSDIVSHRVIGDYIAVVVDRGIAGSPKYTIPLNDLPQPRQPAKKKKTASRKRTAKK